MDTIPGISRDFATTPTLDTERRNLFQSPSVGPFGLRIFGHDVNVDIPSGNVVVSTVDMSYAYQALQLAVSRTCDIQEQFMAQRYLGTHPNVDPRPHLFGNWTLGQEADLQEIWLKTTYDLQITSGTGPNGLFRKHRSGFSRHLPARADSANVLAAFGIPARTLSQLAWEFAPGDLLLRTDRGAFLIASGTFVPETLVDPALANIWVFDPISGAGWRINSNLYFNYRSGNDRHVGLPLMLTQTTDALGHSTYLSSEPGTIPSYLMASDDTGRQLQLNLTPILSYPDGLLPGGTVHGYAVAEVLDLNCNSHALYTYDPSGIHLVNVNRPGAAGSQSITYGYDSTFGVLSSITSLGNKIEFDYIEDVLDLDERLNPRLKLRRITDPFGNTISYDHDYRAMTVTVTVAANGTDFASTVFAYTQDEDTQRRYIKSKSSTVTRGFFLQSNGTVAPRGASDFQNVDAVTEYSNDGRYNVESITDPLGRNTTFSYNDFNQVVTKVVNGRTTNYKYDNTTPPSPSKPNRYDLVETTWSNKIRTVTSVNPFSASLASAVLTRRSSYLRYNSVTSGVASDGRFSTHRIQRFVNELNLTSRCLYDDVGSFSPASPTTIESPLGARTVRQFDAVGNLITVTDPEGNISTFTYDALGRLTSYTDPNQDTTAVSYYSSTSWVQAIADPTGATTQFFRDVDGKIMQTVDPLGHSVQYSYYPNERVAGTHESRRDVPLGASGFRTKAFPSIDHSFTYSPLGNLTSIVGPTNVTIEFGRDELDRLISWYIGSAPTAVTRFAYDQDSQLLGFSDRLGRCTQYSYTSDGYIESISYPAWKVRTQLIAGKLIRNTLFDDFGRVLSQNDSENPGTTELAYDQSGRLTFCCEPSGFSYRVIYDRDGHWSSVVESSGACSLTVKRDKIGRVTALTDSGPFDAALKYTFKYEKVVGIRTSVLRLYEKAIPALSFATQLDYDVRGALTKLEHAIAGTSVFKQGFQYGASGLMTAITDSNSTDLTYDELGQLVYESTSGLGADYDPAGNRVFRAVPSSSPPLAAYNSLNRLTSDQNRASYGYDACGNLVSIHGRRGPNALFYDGMGMLRRVETANAYVDYIYSGAGDLLEIASSPRPIGSTSRVTFHYILGKPVLVELDRASDQVLTWDPQSDVLLRVTSPSPIGSGPLPNSVFPFLDGFSSLAVLMDSTGAPVGHAQYEAWGSRVTATGSVIDPWGWRGLLTDPYSGLIKMGVRWYDSTMGRFISEDALVNLGANSPTLVRTLSNLYLYADNNPVTNSDRTGFLADLSLDSLPIDSGSGSDPASYSYFETPSLTSTWTGVDPTNLRSDWIDLPATDSLAVDSLTGLPTDSKTGMLVVGPTIGAASSDLSAPSGPQSTPNTDVKWNTGSFWLNLLMAIPKANPRLPGWSARGYNPFPTDVSDPTVSVGGDPPPEPEPPVDFYIP